MVKLKGQAGRRPPARSAPATRTAAPRAARTPARGAGARSGATDVDTEQRILEAAHDVFLRHGTAGARMQEIAKTAGVNSALLHYYFRSKERLSEAVFIRAASQLLPAVIRTLASDDDLTAKVRAVVDLELSHLSRAPYLPGYIISELSHHPERARQLVTAMTGEVPEDVGRRVFAILRVQIADAARAGRMHPQTPEQFVVNLLALCVFPFAARPMLMLLLGVDERGFARFIDHRRTDLSSFILRAMRP